MVTVRDNMRCSFFVNMCLLSIKDMAVCCGSVGGAKNIPDLSCAYRSVHLVGFSFTFVLCLVAFSIARVRFPNTIGITFSFAFSIASCVMAACCDWCCITWFAESSRANWQMSIQYGLSPCIMLSGVGSCIGRLWHSNRTAISIRAWAAVRLD